MTGRLLSVEDVAWRYEVTHMTVRRWCEAGLLPGAQKIGSGRRATWAIPASALEGFARPQRGGRRRGREQGDAGT